MLAKSISPGREIFIILKLILICIFCICQLFRDIWKYRTSCYPIHPIKRHETLWYNTINLQIPAKHMCIAHALKYSVSNLSFFKFCGCITHCLIIQWHNYVPHSLKSIERKQQVIYELLSFEEFWNTSLAEWYINGREHHQVSRYLCFNCVVSGPDFP